MIEYTAFNTPVFNKVPVQALSILDIGCGTGTMGKALKDQNAVRVVDGVTYSRSEYEIAVQAIDNVWIADVNKEIPDTKKTYDCIIFSHILEHTYFPAQVLANFCTYLKSGGMVIIALPNVMFYKQRIQFIKGNFKYSESGGLMDQTHFRFFDWKTAQEMIKQAGLIINTQEAHGNFPFPLFNNLFPSLKKSLNKFFVDRWPGIWGFQFVFTVTKE